VSNYGKESLRGFEDEVTVAAEIINGTGEVRLELHEDREPALGGDVDMLFSFTPEQALDLARLLSRQAHEAMRAKWDEENLTG
jgi:hypothetical protein